MYIFIVHNPKSSEYHRYSEGNETKPPKGSGVISSIQTNVLVLCLRKVIEMTVERLVGRVGKNIIPLSFFLPVFPVSFRG